METVQLKRRSALGAGAGLLALGCVLGILGGGVWACLIAFMLWGAASQAFGAVQDVVADREAGIGSIATAFGAQRTVRLALGCYALAGLVMLASSWPGPLAALLAVPVS